MTVTPDQARMLATLAIACRPTGARRWDSAGVMAALKQVADRSLPEVVMATIQAATDRDVDTPGVIPTAGSHWTVAAPVKITQLDSAPAGTRCTICGRTEHPPTDHEYSLPKPKPAPEVIKGAVNALKQEIAHSPKLTVVPDVPTTCGEGNCIRAYRHTGPHLGPAEPLTTDADRDPA